MANGTQRARIESLEAELLASSAEVGRLLAENAELKVVLGEVQKALDAANADIVRCRDPYEKGRPNCPERVASSEQQLVLEGLLESLAFDLPAVGNDTSPTDGDAEPPATEPPAAGDASPPNLPSGRQHGRRRVDLTNLPVETVVFEPPEVTAVGGVGFTLVGAEESDRVAFSPARYTRLRIVRRTYRKDVVAAEGATTLTGDRAMSCDATTPADESAAADNSDDVRQAPDAVLVTAPIPGAVWPGVLADPSAIAHGIVSKYEDLLPLHRQEGITRREGFTVPRSTLCGWFNPAEKVLVRIVDAMFAEGKATAFCMATDATGAPVRPKAGACDRWHVFVFVADQDHVVFRYARTHDSRVLGRMLSGYKGLLLGDATSIYSPLVTAGVAVLVCCWAHVRRYFYKALESDRPRALEAIAIIGKLFEVERACAGLVGAEKTARRLELATPVLKLFDDWLAPQRSRVDPRSPMQAAITYADNQREELRRFLQDGRLRIDNNVCEGLLRNLVLGLNNWQYFQNETGLRWYTTFRSLIASCKLHKICPQRYLECVLRLAPHWSQRRMLELSPKYWRTTAARLSPEHQEIVSPPWSSAFDAFDLSQGADAPTTAERRPAAA